MSEYTNIQKTEVEKAIRALEKLKYTWLKTENWDGVDQASHMINTLFTMQDKLNEA